MPKVTLKLYMENQKIVKMYAKDESNTTNSDLYLLLPLISLYICNVII